MRAYVPEADRLRRLPLGFCDKSEGVRYLADLQARRCQGRCWDSPRGGSHDAASAVHRHPAAATPLRGVVVHPEVVSELVGQSDRGTQWVVRMILRRRCR